MNHEIQRIDDEGKKAQKETIYEDSEVQQEMGIEVHSDGVQDRNMYDEDGE